TAGKDAGPQFDHQGLTAAHISCRLSKKRKKFLRRNFLSGVRSEANSPPGKSTKNPGQSGRPKVRR
ncbi:hypothetical protein, partial [Pantoea piersonii]|uniref:hypothetical protein n=1 Tax=Pantoea piersonii TaxID=2364647 RepID=UPI002FEDE607